MSDDGHDTNPPDERSPDGRGLDETDSAVLDEAASAVLDDRLEGRPDEALPTGIDARVEAMATVHDLLADDSDAPSTAHLENLLRSALEHADAGPTVEGLTTPPPAPVPISRRPGGGAPSWLIGAAAASVLLLGGLAVVLSVGGRSSTDDSATEAVALPRDDSDAPTDTEGPDTGGADSGSAEANRSLPEQTELGEDDPLGDAGAFGGSGGSSDQGGAAPQADAAVPEAAEGTVPAGDQPPPDATSLLERLAGLEFTVVVPLPQP